MVKNQHSLDGALVARTERSHLAVDRFLQKAQGMDKEQHVAAVMTSYRSPETFAIEVHINCLEVKLIIVPIKEALELQKYFVKAVAKFSVARMVCLGSDVALKLLNIIK